MAAGTCTMTRRQPAAHQHDAVALHHFHHRPYRAFSEPQLRRAPCRKHMSGDPRFGFNFAPYNGCCAMDSKWPFLRTQCCFRSWARPMAATARPTFGLPNLQGQIPMHWGTTSGPPTTVIGEVQGQSSVNLTTEQIPTTQPRHLLRDGEYRSRKVRYPDHHELSLERQGRLCLSRSAGDAERAVFSQGDFHDWRVAAPR